MKKVIFCKKGKAFTDFEIIEQVDNFIKSNQIVWEVGNNLIIDCFRGKIRHKEINSEEFVFYVEDLQGELHPFNIDKNGRSDDWQNSQEIYANLIMRMI